ncbi:MAG: thioredoxin fold domain-containing protein [Synechococcaceae cyanobacterium SM2_3_2]|nr:thioredoxin fold domain-containing protein [Synechococcaceae cyanobacterium SM2_3_2]
MTDTPSTTPTQFLRNGLIAVAVILLALGMVLASRVGNRTLSLEELAQQSVPLAVAQANPKPTLMEFYADWCTSCQNMAPMMAEMNQEFGDTVNFVMLNVDNTKWLPEMSQFRVSGIPHFVFMDGQGSPLKSAIGEQPESIMRQNLIALSSGDTDHIVGSLGTTSSVGSPVGQPQPDPRSHG